MKKNLLYILLMLSGMMLASACDNFLDRDPKGVKTEPITSIASAQATLVGGYGQLKNYYSGPSVILGDILTDNCFGTTSVNSFKTISSWNIYSSSAEPEAIWVALYNVIDNANSIINIIDDIEGTASQKNDIKGQAYGLRGIAYMELLKWFAQPYNVDNAAPGVPLILHETDGGRNVRASVKDCYTRIIQDLQQAEKYLVNRTSASSSNSDKNYLSLWAVKGFLARACLYMGDYPSAAIYASDVINSGKYELLNTVEDLHAQALNDNGAEVILRLVHTKAEGNGSFGVVYYRTEGSAAPDVEYVPAASFLELYGRFGAANQTKSADADIRYQDGGYFFEQQTRKLWSAKLTYRYPGNPNLVNTVSNEPFRYNMPKPLKYAEIYLIRAEAYANISGQLSNALADYNYLRSQRIQNYVNETYDNDFAMKNAIANERRRELCFEGHSWYDLKRAQEGFERKPSTEELNYISSTGSTLQIGAGDYRWLFPIPLSELNGNPDIEKNPGY